MARKVNARTPNTQKSKPKSGAKSGSKSVYIASAIIAVAVVAIGLYLILGRGGSGVASGGNEVTTASGLKYVDEVVGTGASPVKGHQVTVDYVGTLENGKKFDSSYDHGQPFSFPIGTGHVINGWDEGVMTMKVGGRRKLIVPSNLGYGPQGNPAGGIPGNATLIFEVELRSVQ